MFTLRPFYTRGKFFLHSCSKRLCITKAGVDGVRTELSALIYVCSMGLNFHLCYPVSCLIAPGAYCEISECLMLQWTALAAGKADKRTHQKEPQDKT
jgi:hypothetical protein